MLHLSPCLEGRRLTIRPLFLDTAVGCFSLESFVCICWLFCPREVLLGIVLTYFYKFQVAEVRKGLEEREESGQKASLLQGKKGGKGAGRAGAMDSHMRDVKKADDNRRMREAFGLGDDYAAGEAFDEEAQERRKEARKK